VKIKGGKAKKAIETIARPSIALSAALPHYLSNPTLTPVKGEGTLGIASNSLGDLEMILPERQGNRVLTKSLVQPLVAPAKAGIQGFWAYAGLPVAKVNGFPLSRE
jgi:hypothetical protein